MLLKLLMLLMLAASFTTPTIQQSPTAPEPRAGHELVWHAGLELTLLINGDHVSSGEPGVIWGWDGESWQIVSDDAPPSRTLGGAAYDPENDTLVLYGGGLSLEDVSADTWLWDGETWQIADVPTPGRRDHFSMTYAGNGIILYGGQDTANNQQWTDTWRWDGAAWSQVADAGEIRYHYAYGYDSTRDQVLFFGGTTGSADVNDLWAWDGESWRQIDRGTGPSQRTHARMAFDQANEMMVLFGGFTNRGAVNDTWLWDGERWTEYESPVTPPARGLAAMAYDPIREKIVLFGGYAENNLGDTWEWDIENGWNQVAL
jgi:hypothetical protein